MSTTALVTGAAGFIGSHVTDELIREGCSVVALDDLSGGFTDNVNPRALFVQGSILDTNLVTELFDRHKFSYVFHLAAYAAEGLSHFIKRFNYTNNLLGSVNLINASVNSRSVRCFVFTSSIAVYGANQLPMTEDVLPRPEDPYGIAKYAVELDLREAHEIFGLDYLVFRPHNVYGERQNIGDRYRNVVGIFMNQIMQGRQLTVFGDGAQTRAFSYIGDVAPCIVRAAMTPHCYNDVFNVGADVPVTVNDLAGIVADAFGVKADILHLPARREVEHAYADHSKLASKLALAPKTDLRTGVAKMAVWAKSVGPRKSRAFLDVEVTRHLPASWAGELLASAIPGIGEDSSL